jgi:isopenicillin N synthase-like dioxygenase
MPAVDLGPRNPTFTIPTVDISPYWATSTAALKVVQVARTAFTTFGFLQIVRHGVSRGLQDNVLRGVAAFFALPEEQKLKLDRRMPGSYGRGYKAWGQSGDIKEVRAASLPFHQHSISNTDQDVGILRII